MTAPPGVEPTTDRNLTDLRPKRNRRAEADRHRMAASPLHRRVGTLIRRAGLEPQPWQVDSLVAALAASADDVLAEPTNEQVITELMRAAWFPRRKPRTWQVGDRRGPWRTAS